MNALARRLLDQPGSEVKPATVAEQEDILRAPDLDLDDALARHLERLSADLALVAALGPGCQRLAGGAADHADFVVSAHPEAPFRRMLDFICFTAVQPSCSSVRNPHLW